MKKIAFFVGLSFLLGACGSDSTEIGQKTTLEVEQVFDAGEVIKGEIIKGRFKVTNTGDYPLVIAEVKGSCSCTVTSKPKEPILPGESTTIEADVNTNNTSTGAISKGVTILANTIPSTTNLLIKATVLTK